jgi:chromosome segregation ATPase
MDLDQATQMINWLDEERRKDKAQIAELANQLTQQYSQIAGLNKSLQDLEERLARLQSQALRYSQLEQTLGQTRLEIQKMIEASDKRRLQADEEQFKIRQQERERIDQVLSSLQLQIEALQQFQRSVIGDHDLITRLDLTLGTLQTEIEDNIKRYDDLNHRIQLLEEWVPRFGQLATEQRQLSERLNKERADAVEASRRAEQARARHMAEWAEQMKSSRREIEDWIANMRVIQEQHKEARKTYADLVEVEERMKQLEARLTQWQRLVEETRRKERDQIVADVEKRWQQQLGEWQFLRDEWNKRLSAVADRVGKLEDWRPETVAQLTDLLERLDKERRERMMLISDVVRTMAEIERQRTSQVDKIIADLAARIEGEKAAVKSKRSSAKIATSETSGV